MLNVKLKTKITESSSFQPAWFFQNISQNLANIIITKFFYVYPLFVYIFIRFLHFFSFFTLYYSYSHSQKNEITIQQSKRRKLHILILHTYLISQLYFKKAYTTSPE